jgi:16S rRNA (guanine(966)-N(2))-methyltransferase RsmD
LRIIGGTAKGYPIKTPHDRHTRPTLSRVRQAVFDILAAEIMGASFLDLFAGCGSVGLEALSRGAGKVVFVEKNPANCALIRQNLKGAGLGAKAAIWCLDVRRALNRLKAQKASFDVVFADPPYEQGWLKELGEKLAGADILAPGGAFLVQASVRDAPDLEEPARLLLIREYRYGNTRLLFYRCPGGGETFAERQ